jgi:hypothetical protein
MYYLYFIKTRVTISIFSLNNIILNINNTSKAFYPINLKYSNTTGKTMLKVMLHISIYCLNTDFLFVIPNIFNVYIHSY